MLANRNHHYLAFIMSHIYYNLTMYHNRLNWNIPRRRFLASVNRKESQGREAFILPFTLFSICAPLVRRRKYSLEPLRPWMGGGGGL